MTQEYVQTLRRQFFDSGYVIIPGLVSTDRVEKIRADAERIVRQALRQIDRDSPDLALDALYLRLKEEAPKLKGRAYDLMGQMVSLRAIFSHPVVEALSESIFDSPAIIDLTQLRIDDASNDRILPMHQEAAQMSLINATVWVPLQDVKSAYDGGLRVVPGSHRSGFLPHRLFERPQPYYGVREGKFDADEEMWVEMQGGDALLFHPLLIHGSVPNERDCIRWTVVGRLNGLTTMRYLEANERHYPVDRSRSEYQRYNTDLEWS